ncbi:MAG TPA: riboflavin biosynthesis protein RibF [Gaiellaceae bacterium]|nr:riboflavin biosynthesis protein RibF [Gaiellaceae bacterium]
MTVARDPKQLEPAERAVAIGTFDGVHRGHVAVVEAALAAGLRSAVLTFDPHPRTVFGYEVHLLATLERRLELLTELGVEDVLVVRFTEEVSQWSPEEFVDRVLRPVGARIVVAGADFRFGRGRAGDLALLERLGFETRPVPLVEGASSTAVREALRAGDIPAAAQLLGRAPELEGPVVHGDQRGGTLGFPTANLAVPNDLMVPSFGIYVGSALGHRAAVSIGVNPHYGGDERRIEAFLLDYEGDLYGRTLRLALWRKLRDERAFGSEEELVAQIARDAAAARSAAPPL